MEKSVLCHPYSHCEGDGQRTRNLSHGRGDAQRKRGGKGGRGKEETQQATQRATPRNHQPTKEGPERSQGARKGTEEGNNAEEGTNRKRQPTRTPPAVPRAVRGTHCTKGPARYLNLDRALTLGGSVMSGENHKHFISMLAPFIPAQVY